ncbi:ubiquitin carboxyl-terminal hydrolase [Powellomyces hirtus]|nr:ubiquitin carboxyl-terminal hydrolase [Powellomyces hirtus]
MEENSVINGASTRSSQIASEDGPDVPRPNQLDVQVGDVLQASPWATLESDPGVFTELAEKLGIKGIQVEELFGLQEEFFGPLKPIYGLIFLFQWRSSDTEECDLEGEVPEGLMFMNQVVNNACATQALLSIALNCDFLDIGDELTRFKEFTKDFSPAMKGLTLSNSHVLRTAHNSFSRQTDMPVLDYPVPKSSPRKRKRNGDDNVDEDNGFHFISYVPFKGNVWEIDGLKRVPKALGSIPAGCDWVDVVQPAIQERMQCYANEAIQFNLMAVVKDRLLTLQIQLEEQRRASAPTRATELAIADEHRRREEYRAENQRRRFNYTPFVKKFLEMLMEKGLVDDILFPS